MSTFHSIWRLCSLWTAFTCVLIVGEGLGESCDGSTTNLQADGVRSVLSFPLNWHEEYPPLCHRQWRITASRGVVELQLLALDMEGTGQDCLYDSLTIYNEYQDSHYKRQLAKLCGQNMNHILISNSNIVLLNFTSDINQEGKGFRIAYSNSHVADGREQDQVTILTARNVNQDLKYPATDNYPNNADVRWLITSSSSTQRLQIYLEKIDIEVSHNCIYDALTIHDGHDSNSTVLRKLCGNVIANHHGVKSSSQYLFLHFTSDLNTVGTGFKIRFSNDISDGHEQVPVTNLIASNVYQYLTYPFMDFYPNYADVRWRIASISSEQTLLIYFESMDIEASYNCISDALTIHDGSDSDAPILRTLCGRLDDSDREFKSSSSNLFLHFTSNSHYVGTGFKIRFSIDRLGYTCSTSEIAVTSLVATDVDDVLTSPGFPATYPPDCHVQWRIRSNRDRVRFEVQVLDIEQTFQCDDDALIFYDGYDDSSRILKTLCGNPRDESHTFVSSFDYVYIRFISDRYREGQGFQIYFRAEDQSDAISPEKNSSNSTPVLVASLFAGVCFIIIFIAVVVFIIRTRRKQQRQRSHQQHPATISLANTATSGNIPTGSQSPGVYVVNPSAPPPPYEALNHAYVHEEPPPSYSEANIYMIYPDAPALNSNAMTRNGTAPQTGPATLSRVDAMAAFKEHDDQSVYMNEPAFSENREHPATSIFQFQESGQEPQPDDEHPPNEEHLGQEQHSQS